MAQKVKRFIKRKFLIVGGIVSTPVIGNGTS